MVQLRQVLLLERFKKKGREGEEEHPGWKIGSKSEKNTSSIVAATGTAQCYVDSFLVTCEQWLNYNIFIVIQIKLKIYVSSTLPSKYSQPI